MSTVDQLLTVLARRGGATGPELCGDLGISQPTLSRLIRSAGLRVLRTGKARAVRYVRTRELRQLGTVLPIHRVDANGVVGSYGTLTLLHGGGHWLEGDGLPGTAFVGLPPFAVEMSPQGYLGRSFGARFTELELPRRITDWNDDHRLLALARRGEDCVGDLIIGTESLDRHLASNLDAVGRDAYPALARRSVLGEPGSSAGGEQPKFLTWSNGRHVLVKFVEDDGGSAARRWRDLLICEAIALESLRDGGTPAAAAEASSLGPHTFLEVQRFDRIGERGRRALLSLSVVDNEYLGAGGSWSTVATRLHAGGFMDAENARRVRWLDAFGQLIANTDRHLGNLSVFPSGTGRFELAPAYDMLPMLFAPSGTVVVERPFQPAPPTSENLDVWNDAAERAHQYWSRVIGCDELTSEFRARARDCRDALDSLRERVPQSARA